MRIIKAVIGILIFINLFFYVKNDVFAICEGCQVYTIPSTCVGPGGETYDCEIYVDGCNGCSSTDCGPCEYEAGGTCHPLDAACEGDDAPPDITVAGCSAPQRVNCANPPGVNWNNLTSTVGPGQRGCVLGNAQTETCNHSIYDPDADDWMCVNHTIYTYACCPAGTMSTPHVIPGGTFTCVSNGVTNVGLNGTPEANCQPRGYRIGASYACNCYSGNKNCSGGSGPWQCCYGCAPGREFDRTVYSCDSICSVTAPNYQNQNYNAVSNSISWTAGNNAGSHQLIVSKTEADTHNHCQSGSCTVNLTNLGATASSYNFTSALDPNTRYYVRVIAYQNNNCIMADYGYFDTPVVASEAWWQTVNGSVHANSGGIFSSIPSIGAQAPGVIIRACKKHSLTVFRFLRFSSFFFHSFLPNPPAPTRRTYTLIP